MADPDCVRVAIRIRPLVRSEEEKGCRSAVEHVPKMPQVIVNKHDSFTYNYVFDETSTQEELYCEAVYDMLDSLFKGYNVTILAYGQTGSGKTYTMGTAFDGNDQCNMGVIPRAMDDIFKRIASRGEEFEYTVTCSFMELYQEQLFDLLSKKSREESIIEMREDRNRIVMPELTEEVVCTASETTRCLMRGSSGRAVAATAMNEQSSRSHAIFTVTVKAVKKGDMMTTTSKFHLVDLAGSERSKKTKATGDRFKEGVKINQGLLALGNVISALGSSNASGFVSYRDSKLTRLLQESLGGNSVTLMIACISPADYNVAETLSTLRYADRARKIKNKPIVNQDPHAAEINRLNSIIQKLRMELLLAGGGMSSSLNSALQGVSASTAFEQNGKNSDFHIKSHQQCQEKYRKLQEQLQLTLHDVAENEMRALLAEAAHEQLRAKADKMKVIMHSISLDVHENIPIAQEKIEAMRKMVEEIDGELEKTQSEMSEHKKTASALNNSVKDDDDGNDQNHSVEFQEQAEAYTSKQMNFKDELRRINHELNLKEELHQRVAGNLTKFCTLDDNIEEKFQECTLKIQELESEKNELLEKLKIVVKESASAKLAEERRKRLQALEQEISAMKRKNTQQAKMLQVREKETQKIKNLYLEIQEMKQSKVKLIRAMRMESENFRQWKISREKELLQLKSKDRKLKSEMARKEALHTKQRNVLKRKCEEAQAINKRLKEALERQKAAQSQRQKQQSAKDTNATVNKIDQVIAWVDRELEVFISLIDAECSLEQLMEDRAIVSNRIEELRQQRPIKNTPEAAELAQLEEELEMRNAQISDFQQKVCANDMDTHMRSVYENVHSLAEARAILKHLLSVIVESRREYAARMLELRNAREAAEEGCQSATKRMRLMQIEHEEQILERERTYEEKIAVLLRELHNTPQLAPSDVLTPEQQERMQIQEEQLNKMDAMRDELEEYKKLIIDLQAAVEAQSSISNRKRKVAQNKHLEAIEILSSSEEDDFNADLDNDPDWKKTPQFKVRAKRAKRNANSDTSAGMDETNTTTATNTSNNSVGDAAIAVKKNLLHCKCRGNCSNKRCRCFSNTVKCANNCACSEKCTNGKFDEQDGHGNNGEMLQDKISLGLKVESIKENQTDNINPVIQTASNDLIFASPPQLGHNSAKVARQSYISFKTTSSKKKFFKEN